MKIADIANNPWTVLGAAFVCGWWLLQHKNEIPDNLEPATIQNLEDRVDPIQRSADNLDYQMAVEGIGWARGKLGIDDDEHSDKYLHEQLCGNRNSNVEGYYPIYRRVTGGAHPTEQGRCD
jgi:hypothetical protein